MKYVKLLCCWFYLCAVTFTTVSATSVGTIQAINLTCTADHIIIKWQIDEVKFDFAVSLTMASTNTSTDSDGDSTVSRLMKCTGMDTVVNISKITQMERERRSKVVHTCTPKLITVTWTPGKTPKEKKTFQVDVDYYREQCKKSNPTGKSTNEETKNHTLLVLVILLPLIAGTIFIVLVYYGIRRVNRRSQRYTFGAMFRNDEPIYDEVRITIDAGGSMDLGEYEEIPATRKNEYQEAASTDVFRQRRLKSDARYTLPLPAKRKSTAYMKIGQHIFDVPRERIHITDVLHNGTFHQIVKGEAWFIGGKDGSVQVVVKTSKANNDCDSNELILNEIDFYKSLPVNKNITKMLGCCREIGLSPYLITEYSSYGDLKTFLTKNKQDLSSASDYRRTLFYYAIDIANGMAHLADLQVVHRYLAAKHILVFKGNRCKIANFTYSSGVIDSNRVLSIMAKNFPYQWMSAEVLTFKEFSTESDVWAFGILMWELITQGGLPYERMSEKDVYDKVPKGYRLKRPIHCPIETYNLMTNCWHKKIELRPTFKQVKQQLIQQVSGGKKRFSLRIRLARYSRTSEV
ncbi:fibroblast growth factor receptor-like isoform X2 [Ptychodera flava]|uniref:fibroblast growth factor receptor-like isoform X2 n=1 Tax=Ptychodera flava TaxID=63121 RepID=UPI00396A420C